MEAVNILLLATFGALVDFFHLTAAVLALDVVRQIVDRLGWSRDGMVDRGGGGELWLVHDELWCRSLNALDAVVVAEILICILLERQSDCDCGCGGCDRPMVVVGLYLYLRLAQLLLCDRYCPSPVAPGAVL